MTPRLLGTPARRLALVVLAALLLRTALLWSQPLDPDDRMVGATAQNFVRDGWPGPTMWNHPRLRDLLVYGSIGLLGEGPFGLKLWSVLSGTLAVAATGWLLLLLGAGEVAALVAAGVVAIDALHVDFSRQGINDVYLSFFPVLSVALMARWRSSRRPAWLVAAGLALGLGLASKWSAAFPCAAGALLLVGPALLAPGDRRARAADGALAAASLVVLPLAVYVLTFWPWFGRGYDLGDLVIFHRFMASETATHVGYPGTKLPDFANELVGAWRWFVQPLWYVDVAGSPAPGWTPGYLCGVSNPLTWLLVWPAAGLAGWRARRWRSTERGRLAALLLALFLAAYLPFVVVPRPVWTNSAVTVMPWAAALLGLAAAELWRGRRALVVGWLAAAALASLLLWFPATGLSTTPTDLLMHQLVPPRAFDHRGEAP